MTNELDDNLGRLIKAGADPLDSKRADRMAGEFARRAGGSTINWGRLTLAASLLICAFVLWRVTTGLPPNASIPGAAQDQPKDDIGPLIEKLGSTDLEERDRAMADLVKRGDKALPSLEKALQHSDAEIRARARSAIDSIEFAKFRGGSLFAGRSNRKVLAELGGGGKETEDAVLAALKWLAVHQSDDGSWTPAGQLDKCPKGANCGEGVGSGEWRIGVTGLALEAFLGAGYTPKSKEFGDVVRKGIDFLVKEQAGSGAFDSTSMKVMYSTAMATQAVIEASVLTNDEALKKSAQRGIDYLVAAKNPGAAWRYTPKCGDNDASVSFWVMQALRVGWHAGFTVPEATFDECMSWIDSVTNGDGSVGYHALGTGKVYVPGKNDQFDNHQAMAGGALFERVLMLRKVEELQGAIALLASDLPQWKEAKLDFYYWHLATQGLFQADGPKGKIWKRWNEDLRASLLPNQCKDGCKAGSWDPIDRWGFEAGRIYATVINALTLETYYRFTIVRK